MSRGGRGGGGGGFRGGRGGGGIGRGKPGFDVPGYDPEVEKFLSWKPLEKFPAINIPTARRPTRVEKRQIASYRALRAQIHEGPLYTVLGNRMKDAKSGRMPQAAFVDPFQGTPTLSDKFRKKHRRIPKLDARPFVTEFFPEELWSTLDPRSDLSFDPTDPSNKGKRKILKIGKSSGNILEELEKAERRFKLENPGADEDDMDQDDVEEEEEDKVEEERDTDYGEDEDDNDDYNAEGYFSNGEDEHGEDGMGDYDDGGGGGYYD